MNLLKDKRILIGITGGIAAYKVPEIIRRLQKKGAFVTVVLTNSGAKFVSTLTLSVLTNNRIYTGLFTGELPHIELGRETDIIVVIPATYDFIGKISSGVADDLLSTLIPAADKKTIFFPSMNVRMFKNRILQSNIATLKKCGYTVIYPEEGELACGDVGLGRLPDYETTVAIIERELGDGYFEGKKVVVSVGGTEENIDPVRVISNRSSGRMGVEIGKAFWLRGAEVTLVVGRTNINIPDYLNIRVAKTVGRMYEILKKEIKSADILIMSAAVSDFIPLSPHKTKIKLRGEVTIKMKRGTDILKSLSKNKGNKIFVGFALEDRDLVKNGRKKLRGKGCDIIVANSINSIDSNSISGYIINKKGEEPFNLLKEEFAWKLTESVEQLIT